MTRPNSLLLCCLLGLAACKPSGDGVTAYVGMELWDGTGAPVIHDAVMLVAGGHIQEIGPPDLVKVPRGATEVRLDGRWVMPGLIDAHTHADRASVSRWLAAGVTTLRDLGGEQAAIVALRDAIDQGELDGPRIYISGAPVDGAPPTWPFATVVRQSGEARRAVGDRVLIDATQVAVGPHLERRLLEVLLDEATALETPVAAELGSVAATTAARLGVHSIERLGGLPAWPGPDSSAEERLAGQLAGAGVMMVPVLVHRGGSVGARAAQDLFVRRFHAAGGVVAAGSDARLDGAVPGTALHDELAALVEAGFTAEQALLAGTRDGARLLGVDSVGTLLAGHAADFVVLTADPLADIANTARIQAVYVAGQGYDPATIRSDP